MRNLVNIYAVIGILFIVHSASAVESLEAYIQRIKMRPSSKISSFPSLKIPPAHTYGSSRKRDPFQKAAGSNTFQPDLKRAKQPLEAYALDALRMAGSFHQLGKAKHHNQPQAIIVTPDGKAMPVKIGDYMGRNYGKVNKITNQEVVVMETIRTHGGWEKRPTSLKLADQDN